MSRRIYWFGSRCRSKDQQSLLYDFVLKHWLFDRT